MDVGGNYPLDQHCPGNGAEIMKSGDWFVIGVFVGVVLMIAGLFLQECW